MNRALVLAGGGAKGAFQIGAVQRLLNDGLTFQVIAGVSTGALNAAMLAAGHPSKQAQTVIDMYLALRGNGDVYHLRFPGVIGLPWQSSLYNPKPIRDKLFKYVTAGSVRSSGVRLRVGATGLASGQYHAATEQDPFIVEFTMASASMPGFFPPVEIAAGDIVDRWVDGGVRHIEPLKDAFAALKTLPSAYTSVPPMEMYVVLCDPLPGFGTVPRKFGTALQIAGRAIDLITNQILLDDLRVAVAYNQAASRPVGAPVGKQMVALYVIAPQVSYMDTLSFEPKAIRAALAGGRLAVPMTEREFVPLLAGGAT